MDEFFNPALIPQETTLFAVWLLGLSLGLTACTVTCLPFMGTWVLGRGGSQRQALYDTAMFVSGRIIAYSMLGAIAGGAGAWLSEAMRGGTGNLVIGLASIAAGGWLLRGDKPHSPCGAVRGAAGSIRLGMTNGMVFGLGAALTPLLILLPLISLLSKSLRDNREWITRWMRWGAAAVLILLGLRRLLLVL